MLLKAKEKQIPEVKKQISYFPHKERGILTFLTFALISQSLIPKILPLFEFEQKSLTFHVSWYIV